MTPKLLIQLGKLGDVLSILPIAYDAHQKGGRIGIMTCAKYAPHIDVSYCDVIPFEGEPHEISKAVEQAKKLTNDFRVTQICGNEADAKAAYAQIGKEHATTESYQKEAWLLAGKMDLWREQPPLVFDRRSPEREAKLWKEHGGKMPIVLVALDGETSAFRGKKLLWKLLSEVYPPHEAKIRLVDLSEVKGERFFDLLALYERAKCIIAIDSAPLHLAYACPKLPVIALVQDRVKDAKGNPQISLWHGSTWRPNHIFHCRYGDFIERGQDIVTALKSALFDKPPRQNPRYLRVFSEYEADTEATVEASRTWPDEWWSTPVEKGVFGRDSKFSTLRDDKRFPFLKDVMRLACLRAGDDDVIVLTRNDARLMEKKSDVIKPLSYAHRIVKEHTSSTHVNWSWHPAVDMFCLTKKWWRDNQGKLGDFIMGQDHYWNRGLLDLMKANGATDLTGCVYRQSN